MSLRSPTYLKRGALAGLVAVALAAGVDAHARGPGGYGQGGLYEALTTVPLSEAQQQQVHAIRSASRTRNAPIAAQMQAVQQQMAQAMLSSGTVTEAQLMPLLQQQESLRQQLDVSRMQDALSIRNLLTGTQLAQAATAQGQLASLHQQERAIRTQPAQ